MKKNVISGFTVNLRLVEHFGVYALIFFSAQNNVVGFGRYRVTRGSPKLVLAAITRSNFRPKKPCNVKLALILELVLCIRSFEEAKGVQSDQDINISYINIIYWLRTIVC